MLAAIRTSTQRMGRLIDDLLIFSRLGKQSLERSTTASSMRELAREVFGEPGRARALSRALRLDLSPLPAAQGTIEPMIRQRCAGGSDRQRHQVSTSRRELGEIEIGAQSSDGEQVYYVKDNGA